MQHIEIMAIVFLMSMTGKGVVTKFAHAAMDGQDASVRKTASTAVFAGAFRSRGSDGVVVEGEALFFDFRGFVVAALLVDPPAVGAVFAVAETDVVAMPHTGDKDDRH